MSDCKSGFTAIDGNSKLSMWLCEDCGMLHGDLTVLDSDVAINLMVTAINEMVGIAKKTDKRLQ